MKKSRKLRPVELVIPLRYVPVEEWAQRHRDAGHRPHPAPTKENPDRWDCDCGGLWRILTREQIRQKFAHLKSAKKRTEEQQRRDAERLLREKRWPTTRPVARSTNNAGILETAERYAAGRPRPAHQPGN